MEAGRGGSLRSFFSLSLVSRFCVIVETIRSIVDLVLWREENFSFSFLLHFQAHQVSSLEEEREIRLKIIARIDSPFREFVIFLSDRKLARVWAKTYAAIGRN